MSPRPIHRGKPQPSAAQSTNAFLLQAPDSVAAAIRRDIWIAQRLGRADLYSMATDPSVRMERQRREILRQGLADQRVVGASTEVWRDLFERVHGEAL